MPDCDLMVIAPHPDDPEFGVGGTVAKWTREGKSVVYVICTNGDKGSEDPNMTSPRLAAIREKEQRAAAEVLGVREVVFLGFPDQGLEDSSALRRDMVRWIRAYRPETVATSDPYRRYIWHRDHRICGQVALDACFPYARDRLAYPDLLADGLMPHKVRSVLLWASEDPNYWVDIAEAFDIKIEALHCHESQLGHRWPELEARLRERYGMAGQAGGYKLAESFRKVDIPA